MLLSLIAVLFAILAYTESQPLPPADTVAEQGAGSEPLLDLSREVIEQIKIIDRYGCLAVRPTAGDVSAQGQMIPLLEAIAQARIVRRFAPSTGDVSEYGLAQPERRIEVWRRRSEVQEVVTIGGLNPVGNAVYARVGDTAEVVMIGSYFLTALDMAVQQVRAARGGESASGGSCSEGAGPQVQRGGHVRLSRLSMPRFSPLFSPSVLN